MHHIQEAFTVLSDRFKNPVYPERLWSELCHLLGWDSILEFHPLRDIILIDREPPATHDGAIEIPEHSREQPNRGVALAVGPDVTSVRVGQRVVFHPHTQGTEMPHPDKKDAMLWLYSEPEILAVYDAPDS